MYGKNFRSPRVDVHKFAMVPRADIPRSSFLIEHQHKTTISASYLYPVYLQEVVPGDSFNVSMTAFCRVATQIYPVMDNMQLESFFFFIPNRLVWTHWVNFMGEQANPADTIAYTIPQVVSLANGFNRLSIFDYFGLQCVNQIGVGNTLSVSALPLRAYNLTVNQWFRDQNLQNSVPQNVGDGPDLASDYALFQANKRHDYFTSCLPWPQKGAAGAVPILSAPAGAGAMIKTGATSLSGATTYPMNFINIDGTAIGANTAAGFGGGPGNLSSSATAFTASKNVYPINLYADMTTLASNTINSLRTAVQTQRLLERDARGGTRYQEMVRSHYGVMPPDFRVQRSEYLGGGRQNISMAPVPSTIPSTFSGTSNPPLGTLAGVGTSTGNHGFRQSFSEHGHVLGLVCVRSDQLYQNGVRRLWYRKTRYDFYFPVFANLGEQAVLNQEIFADGSANDVGVFGYQERYAEMRYMPSLTTGYFNSKVASPLDAWHLGTNFSTLPVLSGAWLGDNLVSVLQRTSAAGGLSLNQQFLCDFFFSQKVARPMPMYSVPGLMDHL